MKAKILWIERARASSPSFIPHLQKKGYYVESVSSGTVALRQMLDIKPDIAVVNAASMRTNGKIICKSLRNRKNGLPIVLITNPETEIPNGICADEVLKLPFTDRKLNNRIESLLPGQETNVFEVGPIRLDMKLKRVKCQGRSERLTPRSVQILKLLMENPGEVVEREQLFKKIWKTDYIGDTRPLDVHISWLRKAIEENPREPQFLITIRGVGYRLDV